MELKQQLRLTQQLVMTPQLQQAIRLLQLSRLELQDEIRKELDDNPILAEEESDGRAREATSPDVDPQRAAAQQKFEEDLNRDTADGRQTEKATREVDWEKFLENRTDRK